MGAGLSPVKQSSTPQNLVLYRPGQAKRFTLNRLNRHSRARPLLGLVLLRRVPLRAPAGQPAPGPARLLRRAHLRAPRPTAREVLSYELDGPRWDHLGEHVHGVSSQGSIPSICTERALRTGTWYAVAAHIARETAARGKGDLLRRPLSRKVVGTKSGHGGRGRKQRVRGRS
jgi:hypothetical protein